MPRSGRERLLDILESIRRIDEYTPGLTGEHSEVYLDAILYNFIVVGEASRNVPQDLQALAPETDWRGAMGMRNVIAHEYFGLDREIVARTVRESLPPLRVGIERLLHELGEG